jgi:hypothetical protein
MIPVDPMARTPLRVAIPSSAPACPIRDSNFLRSVPGQLVQHFLVA